MVKLTDIPPELMWLILEQSGWWPSALNALVRTCRPLHTRWNFFLYKYEQNWIGVLLSAAHNGNFLTANRAVEYDPMGDPGYDNMSVILKIRRQLCEEAKNFFFDYYQVPYPEHSFDRNHPDDNICPYGIDEYDLSNDRSDRLTMADGANVTHLAYALAVGNGHLGIARVLSPSGRQINTVISRWGRTALHYAAYCGSEQGIRFLLECGAEVNATDPWGETALMLAARHPSASCVELLLAYGAGIDMLCNGRTALSYAILTHGDVAVEVLLAHGADVNEGFHKPLLLSIASGNCALVSRLLDEGADPDAVTHDGKETALTLAINQLCGEEVVRMLLESGADTNVARDGRTPLMYAVKQKQEEVVRMLLDRGADVDATDNVGRTALMHAVWSGSRDLVALLLERGADVEHSSTGIYRETPLMIAARLQRADVATLLLDNGADVNAYSGFGATPLMIAVSQNRIDKELILQLLQRGADLNMGNSNGATALDYALNNRWAPERDEIVDLLREWEQD